MSKKNTELTEATTENEPMTPDELLVNAMQDVILGNEPDELVGEFINDFVLTERIETPQILALFEMPTETVVQMFEEFCQQSVEAQKAAIKTNGAAFVEKLKVELKRQLQELAA